MEKFTFFWRTASPFSQWHPADFTVSGVHYTSAEQYMMHQKALLFGDQIIADKILKASSASVQKSWADRSQDSTRLYGKRSANVLSMRATKPNSPKTNNC